MRKLLSILLIAAVVVLSGVMIADAITVTINRTFGTANSDERIRDVTIALDASYPTGGESLSIADLQFGSTVYSVNCDANSGYTFKYDYTDSKLIAYGGTVGYQSPIGAAIVKPALTITKTNDAGSSENALALYGLEGYGDGSTNILTLSSVTNGNTDILGAFEETTGLIAPGTPRYFVEDDNTPSGVIIYTRTSDSRLQAVFPSGNDAYIIAPIEAIADTVGGYALKIKVYYDADAATSSSILYFDDDGGADVELLSGNTTDAIVPADIEILGPEYYSLLTGLGGAEVANTANLSGVTDLKCRVTGK